MRSVVILAVVTILLAITPVYADTIEVTFTGNVSWLFTPIDPVVAGATVGDAFTAILTFDSGLVDQDPSSTSGQYFGYEFGLTIHDSSGDVFVPGSPTVAPILVRNDGVNSDHVGNSASGGDLAHFSFNDDDMTILFSDNLADVNWESLLTESESALVRVRAFNAAVVMIGDITNVSVQTFPSPVPEPSTLTLFGVSLLGLGVVRRLSG